MFLKVEYSNMTRDEQHQRCVCKVEETEMNGMNRNFAARTLWVSDWWNGHISRSDNNDKQDCEHMSHNFTTWKDVHRQYEAYA